MKTFSSSFETMGAANDRGASGSNLFAGIGNVLRNIVEFPQRHAVRHELNELSDRELADIGLNRADIAHVYARDFRAGGR